VEAGIDTRKAGFSQSIQSVVAGLAASLGAGLVMTAVMWLWDGYDKQYLPPPDYDSPPVNYLACWVILSAVTGVYGLVIGQPIHWLARHFKIRKLSFFMVANLLCGSLIGLGLNRLASEDLAGSKNDTLADYGFLLLGIGGGAALWGLIFFLIRRPDRDIPKDVSPSAF